MIAIPGLWIGRHEYWRRGRKWNVWFCVWFGKAEAGTLSPKTLLYSFSSSEKIHSAVELTKWRYERNKDHIFIWFQTPHFISHFFHNGTNASQQGDDAWHPSATFDEWVWNSVKKKGTQVCLRCINQQRRNDISLPSVVYHFTLTGFRFTAVPQHGGC